MDKHINLAGIVHLFLGGLGLLVGAAVLIAFVVFGGVGAAAAISDGAANAIATLGVMGMIGVAVGAFVAVLSLPQMLAGYGLLKRKAWAPMVALVVSAFHLLNAPFGTALALYTGWALLSRDGQDAYRLSSRRFGRLP
jgi:hypothetical protein